MLSDHYNLVASLAQVNIINNPICKCGREEENLNHVIWKCELYDEQKRKLLLNVHKLRIEMSLYIEVLIAKPHIAAFKIVYNFLEKCKINV